MLNESNRSLQGSSILLEVKAVDVNESRHVERKR